MAEQRRSKNRPEYNAPVPANEYGKLPPQALELEEDVLGAIMLEKDAYSLVSDILKPEYFYKTALSSLNKVSVSEEKKQELRNLAEV